MKAFFTVTEDTLSRRMGQDLTLRTRYIVHNVQIYKWKGEEENYQQILAIFSIDIISI